MLALQPKITRKKSFKLPTTQFSKHRFKYSLLKNKYSFKYEAQFQFAAIPFLQLHKYILEN